MLHFSFPFFYAIGLWWLSTGVVLYLDNLPQKTFRWTLVTGSFVLALAMFGIILGSASATIFAAYLNFSCGIVIWGVLEMSYFTGLIAGPHKKPCPAKCSGWQRFGLALLTGLYHDLAILLMTLFLIIISWDEPNPVGTWTFIILWLMRWSAKLNLFLGVPNLHADWLPEHLRYLITYMPQRNINLLFPVSITGATIILVLLITQAFDLNNLNINNVEKVRLILLATLLALALLEHWFLVLPLPNDSLWSWALPKIKKY